MGPALLVGYSLCLPNTRAIAIGRINNSPGTSFTLRVKVNVTLEWTPSTVVLQNRWHFLGQFQKHPLPSVPPLFYPYRIFF
jgi:hypothetical protein